MAESQTPKAIFFDGVAVELTPHLVNVVKEALNKEKNSKELNAIILNKISTSQRHEKLKKTLFNIIGNVPIDAIQLLSILQQTRTSHFATTVDDVTLCLLDLEEEETVQREVVQVGNNQNRILWFK